MSRKIKIIQDYYEGVKLYKKRSVEFQPGLTVLVGCNGAGKSTTIRQIYDKLTADDRPVFR